MPDSGSRPTEGGGVFDRQGGRKYLNDAERQAFFRVARKQKDKAKRAFCLTLIYTGCFMAIRFTSRLSRLL
jgi:hypothetical protein